MENSKMIRKILNCMVMMLISVSLVMPQCFVFAAEEEPVQSLSADVVRTTVKRISRRSAVLDISGPDLKNAGYAAGDVVNVEIGSDAVITLPFTEGHGSVGFRKSALTASSFGNTLSLRTSGGSFTEFYPVEAGQTVAISMSEKGGYLDEYNAWQIGNMSNNKDDFPGLTDEEFANYRCVTTTGIRKGVLYRTSSPINPMIKRSRIADEANRKNRVTTIINLSETAEQAAGHEGYAESYYASVDHIETNMGGDYGSEVFNEKLAAGLRFMIAHPGVYEVNCIFGKDRTGFMIGVLECLMGASYDELVSDYAATYSHYYPDYNDYQPLSERDRVIAEGNLIAQLEYAYGVEDLKTADIRAAAASYLRKTGLSDQEIEELRNCLGYSIGDAAAGSVTYNGEIQGPVVTYEGRVLEENKDYTWEKTDASLSYRDAGSYTATLTGKGLFTGSVTVKYEILPKTVVPEIRLEKTSYTYNGKARTPAAAVFDGETVLNASDYTVGYDPGRKKLGTYKVAVELKGNYRGSDIAYFTIVPKGTSIKSLRSGRRYIKVKWKKQAARISGSHIDGYQIQAATDSSFTKNRKTVNIKGYKRVYTRINRLKSGRKYYVRIRSFKREGKKKYYSSWSKTVKIKTKKVSGRPV